MSPGARAVKEKQMKEREEVALVVDALILLNRVLWSPKVSEDKGNLGIAAAAAMHSALTWVFFWVAKERSQNPGLFFFSYGCRERWERGRRTGDMR